MNEVKDSINSFVYSNEDIRYDQLQSSICSNSYIPLQSHSNNLYHSEFTQLRQDKNEKYERSSNQIFSHNESCYWEEKLMRNDSEGYVKIDENLCLQREFAWGQQQISFNYGAQDRSDHHNLQPKPFNQWCTPYSNTSNLDCTLYGQNNIDKINFDNVSLTSYEDNNDRSACQQKFVTDGDYIQTHSTGSNLGEYREANCNLQNNFDCSENYIDINSCLSTAQNVLHFNVADQQTENSEDSDIIVEETDEDTTNPFIEGFISYECVVCNVKLMPTSIQFYALTISSPVTMTTQTPVFSKLQCLIQRIKLKNCHICSECLGLINAIDHLQSKLKGFRNELISKFNKHNDESQHLKLSRKKNNTRKSFSCYRCKYCNKTMTLKNYCSAHVAAKRRFLCDKCGFFCKTSRIFKIHSCKNISKLIKPLNHRGFTCLNCSRYFKTQTNLKEHQNFCLGILPYMCKISNCGKKFVTPTRLKNHVKLKHDKKFIAICSICNIGFIKLSDYKSHKITHSTDKKFQCPKCNKTYKTKSNLNFHLRSHSEKLPFICKICGRGFMRKEYLETHINNHRGIRAFTCSICQKKFASQKNLDSHFKYHDGSIQKQICNICGKTLSTNMNEHLRIHTNLRELDCNFCGLKFNTKGTLTKHKKIKHSQVLHSSVE